MSSLPFPGHGSRIAQTRRKSHCSVGPGGGLWQHGCAAWRERTGKGMTMKIGSAEGPCCSRPGARPRFAESVRGQGRCRFVERTHSGDGPAAALREGVPGTGDHRAGARGDDPKREPEQGLGARIRSGLDAARARRGRGRSRARSDLGLASRAADRSLLGELGPPGVRRRRRDARPAPPRASDPVPPTPQGDAREKSGGAKPEAIRTDVDRWTWWTRVAFADGRVRS